MASEEPRTARRGERVDNKEESDGQYFDQNLLRYDNRAGFIDWKGREAALELASQALPPFTRCFPVGTLLSLYGVQDVSTGGWAP